MRSLHRGESGAKGLGGESVSAAGSALADERRWSGAYGPTVEQRAAAAASPRGSLDLSRSKASSDRAMGRALGEGRSCRLGQLRPKVSLAIRNYPRLTQEVGS